MKGVRFREGQLAPHLEQVLANVVCHKVSDCTSTGSVLKTLSVPSLLTCLC